MGVQLTNLFLHQNIMSLKM